MNQTGDVFNRKHMKNIRQKVEQGTGAALGRRAPRSAAARAGIIFAVLAACVLFGTSALAMGVPEVNALLYYVLPEAAQFFKPVQKSSVDQGIEVSVESAYIHGSEAEAVITVRDLTSDRLDKSIDLYDSYDIKTGFDSLGTCSQIGYDPETKTATFLIWMKSMNDKDIIRGEKITITVQTLLSGKTETLALAVPMDWNAIPETVKTVESDQDNAELLVQGDSILEILDGFSVTGIGYIDGKLHIQLYTPRRYLYDDHAFLYLLDEQGNRTEADMLYRGAYNMDDAEIEKSADYVEYAFDVPQNELEHYKLYGEFYSAGSRIDGNWSITFPLENQG
ncbi:MAG: hypothetical protein ABFD03_10705 [Clostridiaceae bacterium]